MGQREWWLVRSLWRHDVASGSYKPEEMLLCVTSFSSLSCLLY